MSDWLQTSIALLVVAGAVAYIARRTYLLMRPKSAAACGGCAGCPKASSGEASRSGGRNLVQLDGFGSDRPR